MKKTICISLMFIILLGFFSCNYSNNSPIDRTSKEFTSAYICSMNCKGSGAETPGDCPVCKMEYRHNDQHGHTEEHDHSHSDIEHNY